MPTLKVPITFTDAGNIYDATLESIAASEIVQYDTWHLMIDKYYFGKLYYSQCTQCWLFGSNSGRFENLSAYFEAYLVGWFS